MNIAIVEDDNSYAEELERRLHQFASENDLEFNIVKFEDGAKLIGDYSYRFDLILLDVEMPVMNGIDTARAVREMDDQVLIMFVTNMAQYALHGYEVDAVDYVLKPLNYAALSMKMKKVLRIYRQRPAESIFIKVDGETRRLSIRNIYYVESQGHNLMYHTSSGVYAAAGAKTLSQAEEELSDYGFCRCNSCYLVNLFYIDSLSGDKVKVGKDYLAISRNKKKQLKAALMRFAEGK